MAEDAGEVSMARGDVKIGGADAGETHANETLLFPRLRVRIGRVKAEGSIETDGFQRSCSCRGILLA